MSQQHHSPAFANTLQSRMADVIAARLAHTGDWTTPVSNLGFFRRDDTTEPCTCLIEPSLVMVVTGAKQILIGSDELTYTPSDFLITSLDLPALTQVVDASPQHPCLGLVLKLDNRILAELIAQGGLPLNRPRTTGVGMGLGTLTPQLVEPLKRLLDLLDEPAAIDILAPLIQREIHYRLLMSDQAPLLRQIASVDSQGHRIAKAIDWLKTHYHSALRIEELADKVQMSPPTFHHHFRQLTSMSPLQYQKWLRLNEAKRLMLNEHLDASSAAFKVGYESPSQFSREYSRLFGAPPRRDIASLREAAIR